MKKRNLLILMLVILLVSVVAFGCSKKDTPSDNGGTGTNGEANESNEKVDDPKAGPAVDADTVVIATADETPSLTTADHNAVAGDYVNKLTHNGLFRLDRELNPQPDLVESYEVQKDDKGEETIWILKLREGIKFHDGSDLTADDVVATLELTKTKPNVATYTKSYKTVEKIDDLTVKITTNGPSASLMYDLSHHGNYIVPKKLIDSGNDFNENPIGTGPYKFVEWKKTEHLKFEAFEDFFDKEHQPKIKNIIWKIIPEASSRTLAIEGGEVDYIIEFDQTSVDLVKEKDYLKIIEVPSINHNWLTVNNEKAPFDDINVRKAINCAINKEDVVTVALDGHGQVATAQTPEGMLGWSGEGFDQYDLEKAKEYMKAWGGDPSKIELNIICSNDTKRRAASVIQANLKELGIESKLENMDLATYLSKTAEGDFTGFIGGYSANEMMTFLKGVFHSENINASNKTRTANPELDKLIDDASHTVDKDAREKLLIQATELLNKECYQMPLYQDNMLSARKANLDGTFLSVSGAFYVNEWSWK